MRVTIVGLGLIGGSMGLDLKAKGHHVIGVDKNKVHCEQAIDFYLVNEICELDTALASCDLVVIAVPVNQIEVLLSEILDKIKWNVVVMDVGSTKKAICDTVENHKKRSRFVAGHPLAGTEFSGPKAAIKDLFKGMKCIICEEGKSDEDALELVINILNEIEMQCLFMDPDGHDKHMAYVSHLSHVSAFMLSRAVLDIEHDEKQIFNLASTGFESTVRLAKSSPTTWSAIFDKNSKHLTIALGSYIDHLTEFKTAIENNDSDKMEQLMQDANDIKRVLTGMKLNAVKLS